MFDVGGRTVFLFFLCPGRSLFHGSARSGQGGTNRGPGRGRIPFEVVIDARRQGGSQTAGVAGALLAFSPAPDEQHRVLGLRLELTDTAGHGFQVLVIRDAAQFGEDRWPPRFLRRGQPQPGCHRLCV